MRAVVQRVSSANVVVGGAVVGAVERGFVVFVCAMAGDEAGDEDWLLDKLLALRVFPDDAGKMGRGLADLHAAGATPGLLAISQFTLSAELSPGRSKGNRPSFTAAMPPDQARAAFDRFVAGARVRGPWLRVEAGVFGADMQVTLVNDGPVTLWLDSRPSSPLVPAEALPTGTGEPL
jgi:D-tyrosyl-tRNA(Tyr) deacylase